MFKGIVDLDGLVYDGEIFRVITQYGKEELVLCLEIETTDAPF